LPPRKPSFPPQTVHRHFYKAPDANLLLPLRAFFKSEATEKREVSSENDIDNIENGEENESAHNWRDDQGRLARTILDILANYSDNYIEHD